MQLITCIIFTMSNKCLKPIRTRTRKLCSLGTFNFFIYLALHLSLAGIWDRLTWVRLQQSQEQRYPFQTVRAVFSCIQTKVWLQALRIFDVRKMLMRVTAHEGCTDTVRESALKVDSWRKIP